jgi:hypothetical protein
MTGKTVSLKSTDDKQKVHRRERRRQIALIDYRSAKPKKATNHNKKKGSKNNDKAGKI